MQERFRLFLIGWLGGPQTYMERHGHPRLRMRHAHVPISPEMRDAWMRCLSAALEEGSYPPAAAAFVEARLADVAAFLQNRE